MHCLTVAASCKIFVYKYSLIKQSENNQLLYTFCLQHYVEFYKIFANLPSIFLKVLPYTGGVLNSRYRMIW